MTSRAGALLLLAAPALYELMFELGRDGIVPTAYPPSEWEGCCHASYTTRFHDVPLPVFFGLHLAALLAFVGRRWTLLPLAAMAAFVLGFLLAVPGLAGPLNAALWISALVPAVVVGSLLAIERDAEKAAAVARISMPLLLIEAHALILSAWEGTWLAAGGWAGLLGGVLWAAGEFAASRRPASSASASRPCPLPSSRTSSRRA